MADDGLWRCEECGYDKTLADRGDIVILRGAEREAVARCARCLAAASQRVGGPTGNRAAA